MARRLTLNTAGIKSPLDISEPASPTSPLDVAPAVAPRSKSTSRRRSNSTRKPRSDAGDAAPGAVPFYGGGRPLQTAIALNAAHLSMLEALARVSAVSLNAIAVAALQAGLPATADAARVAILEERVARSGSPERRVEYNLRVAEQLRARVDELTSDTRQRVPRAERADLVNAALARGLPRDPDSAAALVASYARQVELAAAR
jgi:hypothetical protein